MTLVLMLLCAGTTIISLRIGYLWGYALGTWDRYRYEKDCRRTGSDPVVPP